jgi:flagellar biosynthesis/type III secretory pathway protein FliH
MTMLQKMPVVHRLVGLRLLSRQPAAGTPAARRVEWLLSLAERTKRHEAEQQAVQAALAAIQKSLQTLPTTVNGRLEQVAALAVELGLAVAREIVGAALDQGFVDPTPTVLRCLRDCVHGSDRGDLVVHLHPEDLALVLDRLARVPELREQVAAARFVSDPALGRGAVRAETGAGRLRYDPQEACERVAAEVRKAATP